MTNNIKDVKLECLAEATAKLRKAWAEMRNEFPFLGDEKAEFTYQMASEFGLTPAPYYCHPIHRLCSRLVSEDVNLGQIIAHQAAKACSR